MSFETLRYRTDGAVATITLDRPERLNTIVPPMPDEFQAAVETATRDQPVKVIVVRGAGRSFCAGYDFSDGFTHWDEYMNTNGRWDPGKDFVMATAPALSPTQKFMSMWHTPKPVIAQVHGWCVGGGSDMSLCSVLVVASVVAQIGTPYARMWGTYLSGMWIYRLGLTRVKEFALLGRPLSGVEAADAGLINRAVPFEDLESTVADLAGKLASVPSSQLAAQKLVVNQASATAPQLALASFVEGGGFDRHLRRVRRLYAEQMERMIEAVDREFPPGTKHTDPQGGHVLWLQISGLDSLRLYDRAVAQGIHIAPGPLFSASGGFLDHLRLNTGFPWTDHIEAQVATLGRLVAETEIGQLMP
jgi:enoyl-CoA hydratase